jgi:hypothetical protein
MKAICTPPIAIWKLRQLQDEFTSVGSDLLTINIGK